MNDLELKLSKNDLVSGITTTMMRKIVAAKPFPPHDLELGLVSFKDSLTCLGSLGCGMWMSDSRNLQKLDPRVMHPTANSQSDA